MVKVDFKKELKYLYSPTKKEIEIVDVPEMNYLMIDGVGDPNISQDYRDAIEVLYSVSYTLKFMVKKGEAAIDYAVMPLEGLWWADDMSYFSQGNKEMWKWTAMIMQPPFITKELFEEALKQVIKKKNLKALEKVRFEQYSEGRAAQVIYIGPYSEEGPTIEKLHNFIKEKGYELCGLHHEIYLSDPRRTIPEKLVTIIRQPICL
ncbi:MAG: hypothetical protein DDT42_00545 [candidate division WS2 bacterium]|uniref:GyrI-like small molecule binding domain-containing protein n=1 Tax=Psychracetigena formicireducens TaxID=2986056 RepID=A0A9E2BID4_PSYF1|nr:hypothetical protein [Candidatus Psychracetigena formicireducens]MBT9144700.1 hypothetical protein [Candidatus Psychracetigena formicireducens]